jgi:hypothetical protein
LNGLSEQRTDPAAGLDRLLAVAALNPAIYGAASPTKDSWK